MKKDFAMRGSKIISRYGPCALNWLRLYALDNMIWMM